tara:strand:- start:828 stop:2894 length:2067 start_codon:yes stop_codon:yes gene_type:complete
MKIGIIRYPGSNCYNDTKNYFQEFECTELWYKTDKIIERYDLIVIPGGFAFGDRFYEKATEKYIYSPGKMAVNSPITNVIMDAYNQNIPILGICNGFQILTTMGLLPGKLIENTSKTFHSKLVDLEFSFNNETENIQMYTANYYGNYQNNEIKKENIFLKYDNFSNGSFQNIAGIMNDKKTVFGMMPHPERNNSFKGYLLRMLFNKPGNIHYRINKLLNSEHISYKSTKKYLRELYTEGDHVVQGPGENAGIVDIGGGYCITIRIESHNHPTYKNAFEGAATGVGGIIRDIICMGSKPIALLDFLRFGNDENSSNLLKDAIKGIAYYGNTIGVPNVGGSLHISDIYNKNPLVNVACLGIVKKQNILYGNALNKCSKLILCGAKTGNEGVDAAIMSSKTQDEEEIKDMQKADAYLENLLLDAFVEISESNIAEGCQDLGAGGILCATTEVIKRGREKTKGNLGCNIYLDKVSLKYNLDPYSILASETQERMLLVCNPEKIDGIEKILEKWDLEYNVIGEVTGEGTYNVYHQDRIIYQEHFDNFEVPDTIIKSTEKINHPIVEKYKDLSLWETYDHTIGCRTIKGPDKPGQFSILKIHEINKELYIVWSDNVDDCYDKLVGYGVEPLGIVNCLNFGDPQSCIGDFSESIESMNNSCKRLKIPVLGGNVSMYNSSEGNNIVPSIVIVMIGI